MPEPVNAMYGHISGDKARESYSKPSADIPTEAINLGRLRQKVSP